MAPAFRSRLLTHPLSFDAPFPSGAPDGGGNNLAPRHRPGLGQGYPLLRDKARGIVAACLQSPEKSHGYKSLAGLCRSDFCALHIVFNEIIITTTKACIRPYLFLACFFRKLNRDVPLK